MHTSKFCKRKKHSYLALALVLTCGLDNKCEQDVCPYDQHLQEDRHALVHNVTLGLGLMASMSGFPQNNILFLNI